MASAPCFNIVMPPEEVGSSTRANVAVGDWFQTAPDRSEVMTSHGHDHTEPHVDGPHAPHEETDHHRHTHGVVDPSIASTTRGLWALKWSFIGLTVTALIQVVVVVLSGSVGLLADTIHNFADAATAIPRSEEHTSELQSLRQ